MEQLHWVLNETPLKEPKALLHPISLSRSGSLALLRFSSIYKESFTQFVFGNGYNQKKQNNTLLYQQPLSNAPLYKNDTNVLHQPQRCVWLSLALQG